MNLKVRKLETAVMRLLPLNITMESETVLTQYIIKKWFVSPSALLTNVFSSFQDSRLH